jgi:hypothetical protein
MPIQIRTTYRFRFEQRVDSDSNNVSVLIRTTTAYVPSVEIFSQKLFHPVAVSSSFKVRVDFSLDRFFIIQLTLERAVVNISLSCPCLWTYSSTKAFLREFSEKNKEQCYKSQCAFEKESTGQKVSLVNDSG